MPSWSVSSAPQETSSTRKPGIGCTLRSSARATSAAAPDRLSLAPWTVSFRQMSATDSVPSSPIATPARASLRRPASAASSVEPGPARPNHHCGSGVLNRSSTCGARSYSAPLQRLVEQHSRLRRVVVGEHDERARRGLAVPSRRARSPSRATTLTVRRRRRIRRRTMRGPFCASSTIPAKAASATSPPLARAPRSTARRARQPQQSEAGGGRRERAPRVLVLELHRNACDGAQARGQPLGRLALAGRAGRAIERRERLHHLAQHLLDCRGVERLRSLAHKKHLPSPR